MNSKPVRLTRRRRFLRNFAYSSVQVCVAVAAFYWGYVTTDSVEQLFKYLGGCLFLFLAIAHCVSVRFRLFYGRLFLRRNSRFNHLNYDPADLLEVDGTADLFSECVAKIREAGNRLTSIGEIVSRDGEPIHLRYNRLHWILLPAKVAPSQGTDFWVGGYCVAVYGENGFSPTGLVLLGEGDEAIANLVELHEQHVLPSVK